MTHILAVKNDALDHLKALIPEDSGVFLDDSDIVNIVDQKDLWVGARPVLEQDPTYRQIIPYAVIVDGQGRILTYRRTKEGNEGRLHGNASIGFGGHLDAADIVFTEDGEIDIEETITAGCFREINEEISDEEEGDEFKIATRLSDVNMLRGLLIDNTNDVGRVHIGVVRFFKHINNAREIFSNESHIELLGFKTIEEVAAVDNLESWSKIIVDALLAIKQGKS
jgi:predicted NUDIX family phosphoesterase